MSVVTGHAPLALMVHEFKMTNKSGNVHYFNDLEKKSLFLKGLNPYYALFVYFYLSLSFHRTVNWMDLKLCTLIVNENLMK